MKRLFFDIETSPCVGWFWRPGYKVRLSYDNIIEHAKIICVSYKWQGEDKVQTLDWGKKRCDAKLIKDFVKVMNTADEIIGHNGDRFDITWIRTRALHHGIENLPRWRTLDTLKKSRANLNLPSNRLNDIGRYFGIGEKVRNPPGLWENVCFGDASMLTDMVTYCEQDVVLLENVWDKIKGVVPMNTHAGVVKGGPKWSCPNCGSESIKRNGTDVTTSGTEKQKMRCLSCKRCYRISGRQYILYLKSRMK